MHPYKTAPDIAFWSRSVSTGFRAGDLPRPGAPLIRTGEPIATAGSCFASNLVPYLERGGFTYLRTEMRHAAVANVPAEALGYDKFSAAYGNVYTARQLLQLLHRSVGRFQPVEDRWHTPKGVIDPFRPGLVYHALNDREFDLLSAQHLRAVRQVFEQAQVFIFTLGLTEAWVSKFDGAVFPACPGTVAGRFDPGMHGFVNFDVAQIVDDLGVFVRDLRALNPKVRVILTVSPVPLVATATGQHVVCASSYSKSVLRVAAETVAAGHEDVHYFPSYEIITGPQAPDTYFEADRRSVSTQGVDAVMSAFLEHCEARPRSARAAAAAEPRNPVDLPGAAHRLLSKALADAECEEAMMDERAGPAR